MHSVLRFLNEFSGAFNERKQLSVIACSLFMIGSRVIFLSPHLDSLATYSHGQKYQYSW